MAASAFSVHFVVTTSIILFALGFSCGSHSHYAVCSTPYSCGTIKNIGYPFWGGHTPKFCGDPHFLLDCYGRSDYPLIHTTWGTARVLNISTSSNKMTIAIESFFYHLPYHQPNETMNHTLYMTAAFKYSPKVDENITLFYGCNNLAYQPMSSVPLYSDDGSRVGLAFHFMNVSEAIGKEIKSCKGNLSVPVLKQEADKLNNGSESLLSLLQKGIEMEYVVNSTACSVCQSSGGRCGSSDSLSSSLEFVCYCPDKPQLLSCPKSGKHRKVIIIKSVVAVSALFIALLVVLVIFSQTRRSINMFTLQYWTKGTMENQNLEAFLKIHGSFGPTRYKYTDIKKITNSFKDRLGEGGYGHVYKGKLTDGRFAAVKVLKQMKANGEEFINEVVSISRTNHMNVVTLLGFCFEGTKRALVYEFLPNGSLEKFVHGGGSQPLPCETMYSIAVGIARGLDYLHTGCNTRILHFDIKPHNILLDENFCPKISDFGLARMFPKGQSHISTLEARGTIGYIAPEVFSRSFGSVSHKSDVYSFGMMVIDMVCGRTNISEEAQCSGSELYFPQWIYNQLQVEEESALQEIVDDEENKLKRKMILVSLWCIQTYPSNRPSMNKVVEMLEGSLESVQMPPKPDLSSPSRLVFVSSSTPQLTT